MLLCGDQEQFGTESAEFLDITRTPKGVVEAGEASIHCRFLGGNSHQPGP